MVENLKKPIDEGEFGCGLSAACNKSWQTTWRHDALSQPSLRTISGTQIERILAQNHPFSTWAWVLFINIYINDLPNSSKTLQFHLFADDTNIYYSSRSLELIQFTLIENFNSISQWLHANNLALNNEKNNYVIFYSSKKVT